jgi:DNA repair and recombination protein RAD54B
MRRTSGLMSLMLKIKRSVILVTKIYVFSNDQFIQYLQKKKAGLAALSEWKHINCLKCSTGEYIQDDILRNLAGQNVEVNDSSNSGLEKDGSRLDVLSGIDVHPQPINNSQSICNVPGGIISFLFEKSSKANLDDIVDE